MKVFLKKEILSFFLFLLFSTTVFAASVQGEECVAPNCHSKVVGKLIDLVNSDPRLQRKITNALKEQGESSFWYKKTINDMYNFFDGWVIYSPTPETASLHMMIFQELAKSPSGHIAVLSEPFRDWLTDFMMAINHFFDSYYSLQNINTWLSDPSLHMEDYVVPKGGFKSFNEFFTRKLKPGVRPIDSPKDLAIITSPADCSIMPATKGEKLTSDLKISVKGDELNLEQLLDKDDLTKTFVGGTALLCMLNTTDYHRFHSPTTGKIVSEKQLAGLYYGMDGAWIDHFYQHRRGYIIIHNNPFGYIGMVPVGMFTISSIHFARTQDDNISKGNELGNFAYGGSAIILLFEPNSVNITIPLDRGPVHVKMGQKIGSFKKHD